MDPVMIVGLLGGASVAQHLVHSHPPIRNPQRDVLGERGFQAFYSVVFTLIWVPLLYVWWTNRHTGALLWVLPPTLAEALPSLLSALGMAVMFGGFVQMPPTGLTYDQSKKPKVTGVLAITRHPAMMGTTLLCIGHLLANGWLIDVVFFASQALLAFAGALHQDWRHRSARPDYAEFATQTSMLPSVSRLHLVGGRGWAGMGVGLLAAVAMRWAHTLF